MTEPWKQKGPRWLKLGSSIRSQCGPDQLVSQLPESQVPGTTGVLAATGCELTAHTSSQHPFKDREGLSGIVKHLLAQHCPGWRDGLKETSRQGGPEQPVSETLTDTAIPEFPASLVVAWGGSSQGPAASDLPRQQLPRPLPQAGKY